MSFIQKLVRQSSIVNATKYREEIRAANLLVHLIVAIALKLSCGGV